MWLALSLLFKHGDNNINLAKELAEKVNSM